jgi:hypothetical protein
MLFAKLGVVFVPLKIYAIARYLKYGSCFCDGSYEKAESGKTEKKERSSEDDSLEGEIELPVVIAPLPIKM